MFPKIVEEQNVLYVYGEENPNRTEELKVVIEDILDHHKIVFAAYELNIQRTQIRTRYEIQGIISDNFVKVIFVLVEGQTSFIDYIVRLNNKFLGFSEVTKNGFQESGNMTAQRAEKFDIISELFGNDIYFQYLILSKNIGWLAPASSHMRIFRMWKTSYPQLSIITSDGVKTAKLNNINSLSSIQDLVTMYGKTDTGGLKLDISKNMISITRNLSKKHQRQVSDPAVGEVLCVLKTIKTLDPIAFYTVFIREHNVCISYFKGNNKFSINARFFANNRNLFVIEKNLAGFNFHKINYSNYPFEYYCKEATNEEKIGTIALEEYAINTLTYKFLMANHGGTSKTDLLCENGNFLQFPKKISNLKPKIPDLIMADLKKKIIYVIEGKKSSKIMKGLNEVNSNEYKLTCDYIKEKWPSYSVELHLATLGESHSEKDNILFHLDNKTNKHMINLSAVPYYSRS